MQINLGGGLPDPITFPWEQITDIVSYLLKTKQDKALQYASSQGIEEVRHEISNFVRKRGFSISEDQILITGGAKEAIFLLSELFSNIASEEPTFQGFISTMKFKHINVYPIPWDDKGPILDILEKKIKEVGSINQIKYFYVIPIHNPTGRVMTLQRRKQLLELASDFDFKIIEDDIYGFYTYDFPPLPALKSLDKEGRVIYISSFSKIISPGLRIGFIAYEGKEIEMLNNIKAEINHQVSSLDQLIVGEILKRNIIDSIIDNSLLLYKKKRDVIVKSIKEYFPTDTECSYPEGGFFVLCKNDKLDSSVLLKEAIKRDVKFIPGEKFFYSEGKNSFRLSFSYAKENEITEGIKILGELIKQIKEY
ncbi:PLP-dependent aminotransferase family protein [Acidianus manzaensis]|uniref:GntR family transcriptional regulator n=1 Tax=Acidianus manzaensis TaxID=282676 RepID=A0A1W6JYP9_9CREN|nr:PLP-dependent aminotransferase family protein [Acidianus manzaensis]ARM75388.1 GntR family transcriptional regulator [Acidianus manzaensis]